MKMMQEALSGARPAEAVRADIGAFALAAETVDEAAFDDIEEESSEEE